MKDYSMMEPALAILAAYGPDLRNGLTNHAPMVVEALAALGRADAAPPWIEQYRAKMLPRPVAREHIPLDNWSPALGKTDRVGDWNAFFADELQKAPWREAAARWAARLAPGFCASAMHGVIRVGHAVRSLEQAESPARVQELADGFASWASSYQTLPTGSLTSGSLPAREAISRVPIVPPEQRKFAGTIVSSLEALEAFPAFANVIDLLDVRPDPTRVISEMTETFTRVYLANARDVLTTIVFIHGVTSTTMLRSLVPLLSDDAARTLMRYAWQAGCALYAAFAQTPPLTGEIEPPQESHEAQIAQAIANGDEHVIKFTEACLREYEVNPSAVYLAAARHATGMLSGGGS